MAGRRAGQLGKGVHCSVWWEVTCSWQMSSECVGRAAPSWEWWQITLVCCVLQEEHVEPLFQIVTCSALGYGGPVPGECQVPAFFAACTRGKSRCRTFAIQQMQCQGLSRPLQCLKDYTFQTGGILLPSGVLFLRAFLKAVPPCCGFSQLCPTSTIDPRGEMETGKWHKGELRITVFLT